jgi:hypothetical protein
VTEEQELQLHSIARAVKVLEKLPHTPPLDGVSRQRGTLRRRLETIEGLRDRQFSAHAKRSGASAGIPHAVLVFRRAHLIPIARKARALFKQEPKVLACLRLPKRRDSAAEHAKFGLAMAEALRPHEEFCIEEGFRADFLRDLQAASKAFDKRARTSEDALMTRSQSTFALRTELRLARELALIIDADLRSVALTSPNAFGTLNAIDYADAYSSAIKFEKPRGRPRKKRTRRPRKDGGD